ncbi:MAG: hypothetical protein ABDI19_00650 [Armatimonadota bacterium]
MESIEAILELAHDEQLRQTEFEYVDQILAQFPIVHTIIQHEMNTRPWQTEPVSPIDALVHTRLPHPELIPTLVHLLETVRHPDVKEALVRALTVKGARGIANEALTSYLKRRGGS